MQCSPVVEALGFEIFPWNSNLETGIDIIDEQHQQLVYLLNQLASQYVQGARQVEVQRILHELADYARYHFDTEEAIWQKSLGEDLWFTQHLQSHHDFFAYIHQLLNDPRPFDAILEELFAYLTQWLAMHILDSDKRMAKAVMAMAEGLSLPEAEARANEEMSGATRLMIQTVLSMYQKLSNQALDLMREKQARLKAERSLKLSESRWQFLREKHQETLWEWSSEQSWEALWACLSDADCQIYVEDAPELEQRLQAYLAAPGSQTQSFRYRQICSRQEIRWLELRLKALEQNSQGAATRLIGARYDQSSQQREVHLLQQAIYSSKISVSLADAQVPDMPLIYVNPAFETLTGYTAHEVLGKNCRFLHDHHKEQADLDRLRKALGNGEAVSVVLQNNRRDGSPFWNELHLSPLYSSEGQLTHFLGIQQDVTALKNSTAQLKYQAECNTLLFEIAQTFINLPLSARAEAVDQALAGIGAFTGSDRAYIFDYDFDQQVTHNTHEWCARGIAPQIEALQHFPIDTMQAWLVAHHRGEHVMIHDVLALPPDDVMRQTLEPQGILSCLMVPLMLADTCLGFVGLDAVRQTHYYSQDELQLLQLFAELLVNLHRDATQLTALQESEARYRQILNVAPVGIAVHRADAQLSGLYINPVTVQLAGVNSQEELWEAPFQKAIYPDDWPKVEQALQQLHTDQNLFPVDCRILRFADLMKDPTRVDPAQLLEVEMIATPITYQSEAAFLIILVDISERKRHERAIEAQNAVLKEISWLQSHKVRAPLARMLGLIQLLEISSPQFPSPLSEAEILQAVVKSAHELDQFIHEISDKAYQVYQIEARL